MGQPPHPCNLCVSVCVSAPQGQKGGFLNNDIKWNFSKFLVDREGNVVGRYGNKQAGCWQCMHWCGCLYMFLPTCFSTSFKHKAHVQGCQAHHLRPSITCHVVVPCRYGSSTTPTQIEADLQKYL